MLLSAFEVFLVVAFLQEILLIHLLPEVWDGINLVINCNITTAGTFAFTKSSKEISIAFPLFSSFEDTILVQYNNNHDYRVKKKQIGKFWTIEELTIR